MVGIAKLQGKEHNVTVNISGIFCVGKEDFLVWIKKDLPPHFPLGCFVDVYRFLHIVLQSGTMEVSKKLSHVTHSVCLEMTMPILRVSQAPSKVLEGA